jgi:hypothetical protein
MNNRIKFGLGLSFLDPSWLAAGIGSTETAIAWSNANTDTHLRGSQFYCSCH